MVSRELYAGLGIVRVWDERTPGSFQIIHSTTRSHFTQLTTPTIGNYARRDSDRQAAFLGREWDDAFQFYLNGTAPGTTSNGSRD